MVDNKKDILQATAEILTILGRLEARLDRVQPPPGPCKPVDPVEPEANVYCKICGASCTEVMEDQGVGGYEYFGQRGVDRDMRRVSSCCSGDTSEEPWSDEDEEGEE